MNDGVSRGSAKISLSYNSLWPSDVIQWHRSGPWMAQVVACRLMAPNHYLNQCWFSLVEFCGIHLTAISKCYFHVHFPPVSTWTVCYSTPYHYNDVIIGTMVSQITSLTIVYTTVYSRRRSKKTSKLHVTGLCAGNSPVTSEFPAQIASNAENVSIWWHHHAFVSIILPITLPVLEIEVNATISPETLHQYRYYVNIYYRYYIHIITCYYLVITALFRKI